jgi:hypothetical protein
MTDIISVIDAMKVHNGNQWWWPETFCSAACFQTNGHGDDHEPWCRHVALDALVAHITVADNLLRWWEGSNPAEDRETRLARDTRAFLNGKDVSPPDYLEAHEEFMENNK